MRIAIATCLTPNDVDTDEAILRAALVAKGAEVQWCPWDDAAIDWRSFDLCVVRSTWNYWLEFPRFLAWIDDTAAATTLLNPARLLRWNSDKRYLCDLEAWGIAVVPTAWAERDDARSLEEIARPFGDARLVVKPSISGGSWRTMKVDPTPEGRALGEAHLRMLVRDGEAMVQPYIPSVDDYGERSILWIDGALTHSIRKSPRFGGEASTVSGALPVAADEAALATQIVSKIRSNPALDARELLYARVDLARDSNGAPTVMEVELLEPSLFLEASPVALERFVDAIVRHAKSSARR